MGRDEYKPFSRLSDDSVSKIFLIAELLQESLRELGLVHC
jgi:hypothetical protein